MPIIFDSIRKKEVNNMPNALFPALHAWKEPNGKMKDFEITSRVFYDETEAFEYLSRNSDGSKDPAWYEGLENKDGDGFYKHVLLGLVREWPPRIPEELMSISWQNKINYTRKKLAEAEEKDKQDRLETIISILEHNNETSEEDVKKLALYVIKQSMGITQEEFNEKIQSIKRPSVEELRKVIYPNGLKISSYDPDLGAGPSVGSSQENLEKAMEIAGEAKVSEILQEEAKVSEILQEEGVSMEELLEDSTKHKNYGKKAPPISSGEMEKLQKLAGDELPPGFKGGEFQRGDGTLAEFIAKVIADGEDLSTNDKLKDFLKATLEKEEKRKKEQV